jgi:hypothetical protein
LRSLEKTRDFIRTVSVIPHYPVSVQYNEDFDLLAFNGAKEKLYTLGYPKEVLDFEYRYLLAQLQLRLRISFHILFPIALPFFDEYFVNYL